MTSNKPSNAFNDEQYNQLKRIYVRKYMQIAFEEAKGMLKHMEVPISCVIVPSLDRLIAHALKKDEISEQENTHQSNLFEYTKAIIIDQNNDNNGNNNGNTRYYKASNTPNLLYDASRHAEMIAIDQMQEDFIQSNENNENEFNLIGFTLFVTVEPCIMCANALKLLNIDMVIYALANYRFGGCGSVLSSEFNRKLENNNEINIDKRKNSDELLVYACDMTKVSIEFPAHANAKADFNSQSLIQSLCTDYLNLSSEETSADFEETNEFNGFALIAAQLLKQFYDNDNPRTKHLQ